MIRKMFLTRHGEFSWFVFWSAVFLVAFAAFTFVTTLREHH